MRKKILSLSLSFLLAISSFSSGVPVNAYYKDDTQITATNDNNKEENSDTHNHEETSSMELTADENGNITIDGETIDTDDIATKTDAKEKEESTEEQKSEPEIEIENDYTEILDSEEYAEAKEEVEKTILVCATDDFDPSDSGAKNVDIAGNIYILTYSSEELANAAYERYNDDETVIYCEKDDVIATQTRDEEDGPTGEEEIPDEVKSETIPTSETEEFVEENNYKIKQINDTLSVIETENNGTFLGVYDKHLQLEPAAQAELNYRTLYANTKIYNKILPNITESTKKATIVVIDTGADGEYEKAYNAYDGSNDVTDVNGHGTLMIDIIKGQLEGYEDNYEIVPIKVADENGIGSVSTLIKALEYASTLNPTIINMSFVSSDTTCEGILKEYIAKFSYNGTVCISAAGNFGVDANNYIPSKFNESIVVGSANEDGTKTEFSNYGDSVDYYIESSSTSEAAAFMSAMYSKAFIEEINIDNILSETNMVYYPNSELVQSTPIENQGIDNTTENWWWSWSETINIHKNTQTGNYNDSPNITMYIKVGDVTRSGENISVPITAHVNGLSSPSFFGYSWDVGVQIVGTGGESWGYLCGKENSPSEWNTYSDVSTTLSVKNINDTYKLEVWFKSNCGCHGNKAGDQADSTWKIVHQWGSLSCPPANKTLSFNANGHGTAPASQTVTYNTAGTKPTDPSATGYTFGGWYKEAACTNAWNWSTKITSDTTLYAKWTPITYTISYNLNSGSVSGNPTSYTIESNNFTLKNPTRTGYIFQGWTGTGITGSSTSVTVTKGSTGNRTYTATWKAITYYVKYNGNGATSGSMNNSTHTYDVAKNLTANAYGRSYVVKFDAKGGSAANDLPSTYAFDKWTINANGTGASYTNQQSVTNLSSTNGATVNLYVKWKNGNITLPNTTRTGYTFEGWLNENTNVGMNGQTYYPTANVTLNAKWRAHVYTIKYLPNIPTSPLAGATNPSSGTTPDSSHTYDVAKNLTKNGYSIRGYTFKDWTMTAPSTNAYYNTNFTDQQSVKNLTAIDKDVLTMSANWTKNKYTLNFDYNFPDQETEYELVGGDTANMTVEFDSKTNVFTNLPEPSIQTWHFKGWYIDGKKITNDTIWRYSENKTAVAKWEATFGVKYISNTKDNKGGDDETIEDERRFTFNEEYSLRKNTFTNVITGYYGQTLNAYMVGWSFKPFTDFTPSAATSNQKVENNTIIDRKNDSTLSPYTYRNTLTTAQDRDEFYTTEQRSKWYPDANYEDDNGGTYTYVTDATKNLDTYRTVFYDEDYFSNLTDFNHKMTIPLYANWVFENQRPYCGFSFKVLEYYNDGTPTGKLVDSKYDNYDYTNFNDNNKETKAFDDSLMFIEEFYTDPEGMDCQTELQYSIDNGATWYKLDASVGNKAASHFTVQTVNTDKGNLLGIKFVAGKTTLIRMRAKDNVKYPTYTICTPSTNTYETRPLQHSLWSTGYTVDASGSDYDSDGKYVGDTGTQEDTTGGWYTKTVVGEKGNKEPTPGIVGGGPDPDPDDPTITPPNVVIPPGTPIEDIPTYLESINYTAFPMYDYTKDNGTYNYTKGDIYLLSSKANETKNGITDETGVIKNYFDTSLPQFNYLKDTNVKTIRESQMDAHYTPYVPEDESVAFLNASVDPDIEKHNVAEYNKPENVTDNEAYENYFIAIYERGTNKDVLATSNDENTTYDSDLKVSNGTLYTRPYQGNNINGHIYTSYEEMIKDIYANGGSIFAAKSDNTVTLYDVYFAVCDKSWNHISPNKWSNTLKKTIIVEPENTIYDIMFSDKNVINSKYDEFQTIWKDGADIPYYHIDGYTETLPNQWLNVDASFDSGIPDIPTLQTRYANSSQNYVQTTSHNFLSDNGILNDKFGYNFNIAVRSHGNDKIRIDFYNELGEPLNITSPNYSPIKAKDNYLETDVKRTNLDENKYITNTIMVFAFPEMDNATGAYFTVTQTKTPYTRPSEKIERIIQFGDKDNPMFTHEGNITDDMGIELSN